MLPPCVVVNGSPEHKTWVTQVVSRSPCSSLRYLTAALVVAGARKKSRSFTDLFSLWPVVQFVSAPSLPPQRLSSLSESRFRARQHRNCNRNCARFLLLHACTLHGTKSNLCQAGSL